jgi:hypothetical protein
MELLKPCKKNNDLTCIANYIFQIAKLLQARGI